MGSDRELREGSVAARVLEARETPRIEAERAEARLADPPTPDNHSPTAIVFDRPQVRWTSLAAGIVCALLLHGGTLAVVLSTNGSKPGNDREEQSSEPMEVRHVVQLNQNQSQDPPPPPEPRELAPEKPSTPPDKSPQPSSPPTDEPSPSDSEPPPSSDSTPKPQKSAEAAPAAKAGEVVEAESNAPEVADFTAPTGGAESFAGGVTAPAGTNDRAVRRETVVEDEPEGPSNGAGDAGRPVDLDRRDWDCPWPEDAEDLSIDEQVVVLRAVVRPDGTTKSVSIVSDPGFGFGEAALECARSHEFRPAIDETGQPYTASSPPIRVRFTR